MVKKNIWVTPVKDDPNKKWKVKEEKTKNPITTTKKKEEAMKIAIEIAKKAKVEVIEKNKKNRIVSKDSYGTDPKKIKDKEM